MNYRRTLCATVVCGVIVAMGATTQASPFLYESIGQTYTQNFNDYRGSAATLPAHMFVTWDESRTNAPYQGVNTGALTAYTSDNEDYSFGIRERNPVDLRDARLYIEFTNNTGQEITHFWISYDVEAWFIGDRRNRIRMKYDDVFGGGRFETDLFSTDNPSLVMTPGTSVDGSLASNRITVSGLIDLSTVPVSVGNDPREYFGALMPGQTAYFRWQFSNTDTDSGTLRSGLAINNVNITAIPEPATVALMAIGGVMATRRRLRACGSRRSS